MSETCRVCDWPVICVWLGIGWMVCPGCNRRRPVHTSDEGTNSFVPPPEEDSDD